VTIEGKMLSKSKGMARLPMSIDRHVPSVSLKITLIQA
jgi:hypothetical protein